MTDHVARLYATGLALVVFFLSWAAVAAHPWGHEAEAAKPDPRIVQLERRAEKLRKRQVRVQRRLDRRFEAYRVELARRQALSVAAPASPAPVAAPAVPAPSVSTVPAAPVTQTRSS